MNDYKLRPAFHFARLSLAFIVTVAALTAAIAFYGTTGFAPGIVPAEAAERPFTDLSAREAKRFIDRVQPLVLDVRTPGEFQQGHLPDATLIPVQELAQRVNEIAAYRNRNVFIYCRSGNRSVVASNILHQAGFTQLYNLRFGIREWVHEGLPTVVPSPSS